MEESFYQCPYCWEEASILVDVSQPAQNYIEDCEVCCNPIQVITTFQAMELVGFDTAPIEQ